LRAGGEGCIIGLEARVLDQRVELGARIEGADTVTFISRLRSLAVMALIAMSVSSCGYNVIPTKEEAAKATWAEVQNQYQRRADLVPNLVATVQGYAKQEKDVLTQVTEARAKATSIHIDANDLTDPEKVKAVQEAQAQLSGALGRLLAISENYPDLKSNQNFLALQSQLEGTENRPSCAEACVRQRAKTQIFARIKIPPDLCFRSGDDAQIEIVLVSGAQFIEALGNFPAEQSSAFRHDRLYCDAVDAKLGHDFRRL